MRLKIELEPEGFPNIEVGFDQDTEESEPYLSVKASGFESPDELAKMLEDIARSIHANRNVGRHEPPRPTEYVPAHIPFNPQPRGPKQ